MTRLTRTKIICTIGPSVNTFERIVELIEAGMNVARLNFSHGTHAEHLKVINFIKEARKQLKKPVAIMLDTKGPEIRIGKIKADELQLNPGQRWLLTKEKIEGDSHHVQIKPGHILDDLTIGTRVLFDDGYISSNVVEKTPEGLIVEISNGGVIKSNKGVNVPNVILNLPILTETDVEDIRFGCHNDIDIVAASFVRSADHVLTIKKLLAEEMKSDIMVIAKIENAEGIQNFDTIVQVADGIMIARGDLGVEVPLSQVPKLQKMMIRKSYLAGKPSVTATQMLESMIKNPRPTRAEASDVANAIYDSTSAVMLSGETAVGLYPLETVNVMRSIIREAEADFDHRKFFDQFTQLVYHDVPSAVTQATVKTAYSSNAQAIFAFTTSGSTARLLARLRPSMPIAAMTSNERCYHQMSVIWGTVPLFSAYHDRSFRDAFNNISNVALEQQIVSYGDLVVVTTGSPFGISGTTNMMVVENIGEVLVRGHAGTGSLIHGRVSIALSHESRKIYEVSGTVLVITKCDENYAVLIREALGVILENHINDTDSERYLFELAKSLKKPFIVRGDGAIHILKEGQLVTLDPEKALVYKGVVF